ncbi:MAG: zinc metalloprotease [Chloroflexi bacterium]|nr:zinc metalloprotease [Chloroflexota bacterium]
MQAPRRALALVAAVTLAFSASITPAFVAAAGGSGWAECLPDQVWSAMARSGPDKAGREKDDGQTSTALPARARGKAPADFSVTVPVWFHVITDGSAGQLSDQQIRAQIRAINDGFGGREGGFDTGFSFELAGVTRTDNARWYASRSGGAEHEMKHALKTGGDDTLNVYSTSGGAYLGWAYLPEITDTAQAYLDGIVIDWRTVPGASDAYHGRYDEGDTLTHEAGHWLNLEHTFYGGCNKTGDFIDDTPPEKSPAFGCPEGRDTCKAPGLDPIHNYMDYSDDPCLTEFTPGQTQRMADSWLLYRAD